MTMMRTCSFKDHRPGLGLKLVPTKGNETLVTSNTLARNGRLTAANTDKEDRIGRTAGTRLPREKSTKHNEKFAEDPISRGEGECLCTVLQTVFHSIALPSSVTMLATLSHCSY